MYQNSSEKMHLRESYFKQFSWDYVLCKSDHFMCISITYDMLDIFNCPGILSQDMLQYTLKVCFFWIHYFY